MSPLVKPVTTIGDCVIGGAGVIQVAPPSREYSKFDTGSPLSGAGVNSTVNSPSPGTTPPGGAVGAPATTSITGDSVPPPRSLTARTATSKVSPLVNPGMTAPNSASVSAGSNAFHVFPPSREYS